MPDEQIEVGDHVIVGSGKIHWTVKAIYPVCFPPSTDLHYEIHLSSGMTGVRRTVMLDELTLHKKGSS